MLLPQVPRQACHQVPVEHCKDVTIKIGKKICTPQQDNAVVDNVEMVNGGKNVRLEKVDGGKKATVEEVISGKKSIVEGRRQQEGP